MQRRNHVHSLETLPPSLSPNSFEMYGDKVEKVKDTNSTVTATGGDMGNVLTVKYFVIAREEACTSEMTKAI